MTAANSKWTLLLFLPLAFAGVWRLQHGIDAQRARLHEENEELVLRSGKLVKVMSFEYAPLMADIYWTRVVQYFGNKHFAHDSDLEALWPLLDVTTTLDPNLIQAYRFGGVFLSDSPPRGAGRPDLAVKLIERGIRENPDYWRFYGDLGYVYYFDAKDYKKASEAFYEGSKKPGAAIWMKIMAAKIAAEGESFATSVFLWREVYESSPDPDIKKNALTHLQLLKAQQDCQQIDVLSDQYEKRFGRSPAHIVELQQAGFLGGLPVDPLGFIYMIGQNGKAGLNPNSPLAGQQAKELLKK